MLTEQRFEEILKLLEEKGTITVQELKEKLNASESTIRRDLTALHDNGKLIKVFGGAVALDSHMHTKDTQVADRRNVNKEEKIRIARYAAALIKADDFVYLDAGTTTGYMIDYIEEKQAVYVTNGVSHAKRLAAKGLKVILIGGELKSSTEAVIGSTAAIMLQKYHFTVGFWGTNGVNKKSGFTTPDHDEAMIKQISMGQTDKRYVLCDHNKFSQVSTVSFGAFSDAMILTDRADGAEFKTWKNVRVVSE
ncbi:MAG: DeoR/GlpR family DNA-binding transcription regulator [Lachnospiraceae bacterium]|nr:DeoR/GlpR family DNA-binding transcription regulator [Lachnospiraceae bacterium]